MKRLVAAIVGIAFGLLLCEGAVRLLASRLLSLSHPAMRFDPQLAWVQDDGEAAVRRNEAGEEVVIAGSPLGIRQPPRPYRFDGKGAVLLLGDSTTAGTQVRLEQTWGAELERRLRGRRPDLEVVNAGVDRYDLSQQYRLAERLWGRVRPVHVIVALYVGNDIIDYERSAQARPPWQGAGPGTWIREHSYLVHYVTGALSKSRRREEKARARAEKPDPILSWSPRSVPGWEDMRPDEQARIRGQFSLGDVLPALRRGEEGEQRIASTERLIAAFAARAQERGAGFTLVVLPMKQEVVPEQRADLLAYHGLTDADLARPRERLAALAKKQGFGYLDAAPALAKMEGPADLFWRVDWHMTPRGHAALAEILAPEIDAALGARARRAETGS